MSTRHAETSSTTDTDTHEPMGEGQNTSGNAPNDEESIGVALSGGGLRATLFSLGALMYFVDSGYSRYVSDISSVSGGSITNAFVAQHIDFKNAHEHPDQFDEVAKKLARSLTEKGLLSTRYFGFGILAAIVLTISVLWWFCLRIGLPWWGDVLLTVSLLSALGTFLLLRGQFLSLSLRRVLFTDDTGSATKLAGIKRQVRHVFCATDLNSGKPFYFTNLSEGWVGNGEWGFWKAGDLNLAEAVRSSAAFPAAFSPKRLELNPKDQVPSLKEAQQKGLHEPPPTAVFLADGGVWNNLGTAWFDDRVDLAPAMDPKVISQWWTGDIRRLVVINASAPLKPIRSLPFLFVPFLAEFVGFFRFINVLYSSTISPRIASLYDAFMLSSTAKSIREGRERLSALQGAGCLPAVVQIDQNHWWEPLARKNRLRLDIYQAQTTADEIRARCEEPTPFDVQLKQQPDHSPIRVITQLVLGVPCYQLGRLVRYITKRGTAEQQQAPAAVKLADMAAQVPTTLSRISRGAAFQVLLHGYLSTWRVMETMFGPRPMKLPDMKRFAEIVGVWNLTSSWHSIEGRLTLKVHFTEDTYGTYEELDPIPSPEEILRSPELLQGLVLRYQTGAKLGDPNAMVKYSDVLAGRGQLDEAAYWLLEAQKVGVEKGELYLARFYRVAGYQPSASAGEDQIRQWNSWNKGVETFTKLEPETLNLVIQIFSLPPKARQSAVEALPAELRLLFDADELSQEIDLELAIAALARIQGPRRPC